MKSLSTFLTLTLTCLLTSLSQGQEPQKVKAEATATATVAPTPSQEDLEKTFIKTLTQATFHGRWCLVQDGKPGPPRDEKYIIKGITKVGEDLWLILARIQYGKTDVSVPIPVNVFWAGDTPVISITDMNIPGVGSYTARVLIHSNTYAGTWSGGDHAGLLNGTITHEKQPPAHQPPPQ